MGRAQGVTAAFTGIVRQLRRAGCYEEARYPNSHIAQPYRFYWRWPLHQLDEATMADDKTKTDGRDRSRVSGSEPDEVEYFAESTASMPAGPGTDSQTRQRPRDTRC
jgi:hypothetical protein